jgi:transcriptional regulator with XRE-family HTH domain/quercetin dioxygenase-like cupin family protein
VNAPAVPPIGARLREARQKRGVSVRGLARAVDVSASLISQIETGKSSPSVSTLYAITTALGISVEDVFSDPDGAAPDAGVTAEPTMPPDVAPADRPVYAPGFQLPASKRRVGPVVRGHERESLHLDSGVTWELLGQLPDTHVDFLRITYAPGGSSSGAGVLMRHSGTEYGHVLRGQLTLTLGFEAYVLGPGDSVSFDSTAPHGYANHGDEPAVGIWFVTS